MQTNATELFSARTTPNASYFIGARFIEEDDNSEYIDEQYQ